MVKTEGEYGGGGGNNWGIICEACELAPAVLICKADAASLCAACDGEIHSANPLARRHLRLPIYENEDEDEDEAASWLLLNKINQNSNNELFLLGEEEEEVEEEEEYLKFVEFGDEEDDQFKGSGAGGDSVVPVDQLQQYHGYEMYSTSPQFDSSKPNSYSFNAAAFLSHHAVSVSSMEVGVVPDSTTTTVSDMSIISNNARPPKGTIDLFSGAAAAAVPMAATQLSPMDREARVLRYREKKKTRKFEKTIRYASRKAYAETRPRIKGRFAKRTDVAVHVDRNFSSNPLMADAAYGIVPSF